MKVRITWFSESGLEWSDEYEDMDLFTLKVNNCVMNRIRFKVDYL